MAALSLSSARSASAQGATSVAGHTAIEQRVALAIGPSRTTMWTQLRADAQGGALAVVIPAAPGATLDWVSPAWFEALEAATAPRILPPPGPEPTCPGEPPVASLHIVGALQHTPPLVPQELQVLDTAAEVSAWAQATNMPLSSALDSALMQLPASRFVVVRYQAPAGEVLTQPLRIVSPQTQPWLPLALTEAGAQPLAITVWTLAEGTADIEGADVALADSALSFDAAEGDSNYRTLRSQALELVEGASLLEASGRDPLLQSVPLPQAEHVIEPLLSGYFNRGAQYASEPTDAAACIAAAGAALDGSALVSFSCPRADLGVVPGGGSSCVEAPAAGEIDPELLRCGAELDDVAVALSELSSDALSLSRFSMQLGAGETGATLSVSVGAATEMAPVWTASELDLSGCDGAGGAGGSGSGASGSGGTMGAGGAPGSGGGTSQQIEVPVYEVSDGCSGREVGDLLFYTSVLLDEGEEPPDAYYQEESCSGGTESYAVYDSGTDDDGYDESYDDGGDGCSSDSTESYYEESYDDGGDGCSSDTTDSYYEESYDDGSYDDGGDGCSSESTESYYEESYDDGGDGCDGSDSSESYYEESEDCGGGDTDDGYYDESYDDSGDSCSGGDSESSSDCTVVRVRRKRRPRMSMLVFFMVAIIAPLRRLSRPGSRARHLARALIERLRTLR